MEASEEAKAGDWDDINWGGYQRRGMSRGRQRQQRGAIGLIFRDRCHRPRGRPGGSDHPDGRGRAAGPGTTGGRPHGGRRRPPSFVVRGRGPDDARPSGRGTLRNGAPMPRDPVLQWRLSISALSRGSMVAIGGDNNDEHQSTIDRRCPHRGPRPDNHKRFHHHRRNRHRRLLRCHRTNIS